MIDILIIRRLLLSVLLAVNRTRRNKQHAAGLRTHILVSLAHALLPYVPCILKCLEWKGLLL